MYGSFLVDPTKGSEPICSWVCNFPMDVIHPPTPTSHWGWKKVSSAAVGGHVHARGNELGLIDIYNMFTFAAYDLIVDRFHKLSLNVTKCSD